MPRPSHDPSVHEEPHLRRKGGFAADPSEARVARQGRREPDEDEAVEQSVWDEPVVAHRLAGLPPPDALTYRAWLQKRRAATGPARSWLVTLAVALAAGPWAVLGAFWGAGQTPFSVIALVVFGPLVEEMMKVAAALYLVEKRPFLFSSRFQILLCAVAGGLAFAALENLLYLHVYVPLPPPLLVHWRWTVCIALHTGCSLVAGMGLMRVWADTWRRLARPRLSLAYPYLLGAIILHGAYNAGALALAASGLGF